MNLLLLSVDSQRLYHRYCLPETDNLNPGLQCEKGGEPDLIP